MKIKTKLTLGVGLLFILIILLSLVSAKYVYDLKISTENILIANYSSLEYSRNMLSSLEDVSINSLNKFESNLQNQEKNITEIGEYETTLEIRNKYMLLLNDKADSNSKAGIRKAIFTLMDMNMQAIQRKSILAKSNADKAVFWIALTGTMCFLIAFILLINLPSNIADPIQKLTESIQHIANEKYSERVHFESHSEFGQLARSFNTMAEKLEEYNNSNLAKLMMEKKRIEALINIMHDPVIGIDENFIVIFANKEALRITGLTQNELVGKWAQDIALKNDLMRLLIRDIKNETVPISSNKLPIKIFIENKECYFENETLHISLIPTGDTSVTIVGHVILLRNVTTYKELDTAKTNFIATISHEFKTPISSIKMSLQLLENVNIGTLNNEQKKLVESINDDANRLLKITAELLNMTQVESGNIQLSIGPSNPKEILSYAINATKTQADSKQIQFEINYPETIAKIQADSEKTAWVLTNLIANAIRYSYDNSKIFLAIQETSKHVIISVKDTGQGIAPQYKNKIFDRYFRVPGTKKDGTGLGLAISKEFIEAQGGQITVDSEYGSGSTFCLTMQKAT